VASLIWISPEMPWDSMRAAMFTVLLHQGVAGRTGSRDP
jgi:hypothetical protein